MIKQTLTQLLADIIAVPKEWERVVTGLASDSRKLQAGDLFFARVGMHTDGHDFIDAAIEKGAVAVVCAANDELSEGNVYSRKIIDKIVPIFAMNNLDAKIGIIAARFFSDPSKAMSVIGVTGTNGKSTICHYLASCLHMAGIKTGVIGTLGYGLFGHLHAGSLTTPDPIQLQQLFASFRQQDVNAVVMEVSSHSLIQNRVNGVDFDIAIFSNLTRDHLDYHSDMRRYGEAKSLLFQWPRLRYAIINIDDKFGRQLTQRLLKCENLKIYTYSSQGRTRDYHCPHVSVQHSHLDITGITASISTPWGDGVLHAPLLGRFQLSNLLAALTALCILDIPLETTLTAFTQLTHVSGRMEVFGGGNKPLVIVDYAHTPDALQQALTALREYCLGKLWVVFGCGGDRDQGKRPLMGKIAESYADHIILTDDNPRNEDAKAIIFAIMRGLAHPEYITVEHDRNRAIAHAIACANKNDIVLVAGKGHETFQIIGAEKRPFNDAVAVQMQLTEQ